jgi:hypothetical protein
MRRQYAIAALLILSVAGSTACKMTQSDCESTYNLMAKSKDGCIAAFPTLHETITPTPGPKIIIRPTTTFVWYTNSGASDVLQPAGNAAWTTGKIRSDFCGTITDFTVDDASSTAHSNSSYVVLQSKVGMDTYTIEIWRTSGDVIRWYITKGNTRKLLTCDASEPTDKVPQEFLGTLVSFREELADVDLTDVNWLRTAN